MKTQILNFSTKRRCRINKTRRTKRLIVKSSHHETKSTRDPPLPLAPADKDAEAQKPPAFGDFARTFPGKLVEYAGYEAGGERRKGAARL